VARFLHIADTHVDYQQYGIRQRERDGYAALEAVAEYAISEQVQVLMVAGDFFHSKDIRARAWVLVRRILERLKRAGVEVVMVEGNHDRALFGKDETWVETLHSENLAWVLGSSGEMEYKVPGAGVRIVGIPYLGHQESEALDNIYQILDQAEKMTTILLCHIGVSDVMDGFVPGLSFDDVEAKLHPTIKYMATGHFHKPWSRDRVHCPGTIFPNKVDEPYGGMFQFEADALGIRDVTYIPITDICQVRPIIQAVAGDLEQVAALSKGWGGAIVQLVYAGAESRGMLEAVFEAEPLKFIPVYRSETNGDQRRHYQASSTGELEAVLLEELLGDDSGTAVQLMAYAMEQQPTAAMVELVKETVGVPHED